MLWVAPTDLLVSFDVTSLFTWILLEAALELLQPLFPSTVIGILQFAFRFIYFLYDGWYYEQTDGIVMGSPLYPMIANIYMDTFEHRVWDIVPFKPSIFYWYVDNTFLIWSHGKMKLGEFLDFVKGIVVNTQCTMEVEKSREFHSWICSCIIRVYHAMHTNLYLSFLIYRARGISDGHNLPIELEFCCTTFLQNGYRQEEVRQAFTASLDVNHYKQKLRGWCRQQGFPFLLSWERQKCCSCWKLGLSK